MAARTITGVQQAMWNMVRMRIQDILDVRLNVTQGNITIASTLGNVFTSEKAVALLLRWHIFRPGHVTTGDRIRQVVRDAITNNPNIAWNLPVAQWTDAHETAITASLLTAANLINATHAQVANWPAGNGRNGRGYVVNNQLGAIRTTRNSFRLDSTDI